MTEEPALPLAALQARLSEALRGLEHPPLGASTALAEECGEVAKLILDHHAYGKPLDPLRLGGELADVLVCLCEIATLHGIDLEAAARTKAADVSARAPAWRRDLGPSLDRAWERGSGPAARRPRP